VQVNANHLPESIAGLLTALGELKDALHLPGPEDLIRLAA
jgi:hypothetical protein